MVKRSQTSCSSNTVAVKKIESYARFTTSFSFISTLSWYYWRGKRVIVLATVNEFHVIRILLNRKMTCLVRYKPRETELQEETST